MRVDHFERYTYYCNNESKHPPNDDIQNIRPEQIVLRIVEGTWDFTHHTAVFKLFNNDDIKTKFEELF